MKKLYLILAFALLVTSCGKKPHIIGEFEKQISSSIEVIGFAGNELNISFKKSKADDIPKKDNQHLYIAWRSDYGWIRIGDTKIDWENGTASASVYHPGEYAVVIQTKPYGIHVLNAGLESTENPLLLIHGCFNSKVTWQPLLDKMVEKGKFERPIWIFDYPQNSEMEEIGILLSDELIRLEDQYDDYKLDVFTHSLGGIVVSQFVGGLDYQVNMDRLLTVAPPFIGTNLVKKSVLEKIIEKTTSLDITDADRSLLFVYSDILGKQSRTLLPNSNSLKKIFKKYSDVIYGRSDLKLNQRIMDEALLGNYPWIRFDSIVPEYAELKDYFGDGVIDTRLERYQGRIGALTPEPFPCNHYNITHDQKIINKMADFLDVSVLYFSEGQENPTLDDFRLEAETNIKLGKWRGHPVSFLREYAKNMLTSCDSNAILFTNGDNDTFYPWELQLEDNFRTDVRVVNLSLLNTPWYIRSLIRLDPKVPIRMTDIEIDRLSMMHWTKRDVTVPVPNFKQEQAREELKQLNISNLQVEDSIQWTLSATYPTYNPKAIRVQDLMVLRIINDTKWERPIHFANTVSQTNLIGLNPYLNLEGIVYKLKPYKTEGITPEVSRQYLLEKFEYTSLTDPNNHNNKNARAMAMNYLASFVRLANFYFQKKQNSEVCTILNEMANTVPKEMMHFSSYSQAIGFANFFHRAECPFEYSDFLAAVDPMVEKKKNDYLYIENFYMEIMKDTKKAEETFQQLLKIAELSDLKLLKGYYEKKDYGGNRLEQIAKLIEEKSDEN